MTVRSRHHVCHTNLSWTPPSVCVPGLAWTQSPYTSRRRRSSRIGLYPGTSPAAPSPSSGGVSVSVLLADFSSPFPCAAFPSRARVVCCAACPSFVFPCYLLRFPVPFPSVSPLISVPYCWVWGARLTHSSRHRSVTKTRAALPHSHRAFLHVDIGPHLQQASTARQAKCTGAVVCSAGAVPFSFPPFSPLSFTERHARFTLPSLSLTPSIARRDVADVTSELYVYRYGRAYSRRTVFSRNFSKVVFLPPLFVLGGWELGGGIFFPDRHHRLHHEQTYYSSLSPEYMIIICIFCIFLKILNWLSRASQKWSPLPRQG